MNETNYFGKCQHEFCEDHLHTLECLTEGSSINRVTCFGMSQEAANRIGRILADIKAEDMLDVKFNGDADNVVLLHFKIRPAK